MKKTISLVLCLCLMLSALLCTGAMAAAADNPNLSVRVNGQIVSFPDAQPFVDGNSRTLIPVRFVSEQLGASVSWNGKTSTATIQKNGIKVDVTIGETNLRVTKNGKAELVQMDTAAVIQSGRTYVPIRFVAEALGAYVDYSDYYHVIGIYNDELTDKEIAVLHDYGYTVPAGGRTYADFKAYVDSGKRTEADLKRNYGVGRESFGNFANARGFLYRENSDAFYSDVISAAKKCIAYESERIAITFRTDASCIYQSDSYSDITCAVRGIAVVHLKTDWHELTNNEIALASKLGVLDLGQTAVDLCVPVDIHMNTLDLDGAKATLNTIKPLAEQYLGGTR